MCVGEIKKNIDSVNGSIVAKIASNLIKTAIHHIQQVIASHKTQDSRLTKKCWLLVVERTEENGYWNAMKKKRFE